MMAFEQTLEILYHVVIILKKDRQELVKSRIFLNYGKFKFAFYIAFLGSFFFLIENALGLVMHDEAELLHSIGESLYNLCIMTFIFLLYLILRKRGEKKV
jgi:hypothetical protein